ncbi:MAG: hypothetical protein ACLGXA_18280 [Acidobacteriota bacterium]
MEDASSTPSTRRSRVLWEVFTDTEAEALKGGFIPREMEHKWFICFHDGWLLFYRSWTGFCIYGLRRVATPEGMQVIESWVSRDPEQYRGTDIEDDRKLVRHLMDEFLLHRPEHLPVSGSTQDP